MVCQGIMKLLDEHRNRTSTTIEPQPGKWNGNRWRQPKRVLKSIQPLQWPRMTKTWDRRLECPKRETTPTSGFVESSKLPIGPGNLRDSCPFSRTSAFEGLLRTGSRTGGSSSTRIRRMHHEKSQRLCGGQVARREGIGRWRLESDGGFPRIFMVIESSLKLAQI